MFLPPRRTRQEQEWQAVSFSAKIRNAERVINLPLYRRSQCVNHVISLWRHNTFINGLRIGGGNPRPLGCHLLLFQTLPVTVTYTELCSYGHSGRIGGGGRLHIHTAAASPLFSAHPHYRFFPDIYMHYINIFTVIKKTRRTRKVKVNDFYGFMAKFQIWQKVYIWKTAFMIFFVIYVWKSSTIRSEDFGCVFFFCLVFCCFFSFLFLKYWHEYLQMVCCFLNAQKMVNTFELERVNFHVCSSEVKQFNSQVIHIDDMREFETYI